MSKFHNSIIVVGCILAVSICIFFQIPLYFGFFSGVILSMIVFVKNGFSIESLTKMMIKGISECTAVFLIVLLIGGIIAIWMASGIVPSLIYYGFNYIENINFLLACFIITAAMAMVMGTALGTLSTIGMVLLAIGKGIEIPFPIILGAVISGAFIADKASPLGSMINLTLRTVNVQYKELARHMSYTVLPTVIITSLVYYIIGLSYNSEVDLGKITSFQISISDSFIVTPLFLLIPLCTIVMALLGIKVMPNLIVGLFSAISVGFIFQNLSVAVVLKTVIFGYQGSTGIMELDSILKGGGILPMLEVVLIISSAIALNSLFEGTRFINSAIDKISSSIKTKGDLVIKTGLLSMLFTAIGDQSVGVLVPGKFLQKKFEQLEVPRVTLARTVADTGTSIAPIIPWNVNTIVITTITGVSVFEYGPFVFLSLLSPIITMLVGYISNTEMKRVEYEKEHSLADTE